MILCPTVFTLLTLYDDIGLLLFKTRQNHYIVGHYYMIAPTRGQRTKEQGGEERRLQLDTCEVHSTPIWNADMRKYHFVV